VVDAGCHVVAGSRIAFVDVHGGSAVHVLHAPEVRYACLRIQLGLAFSVTLGRVGRHHLDDQDDCVRRVVGEMRVSVGIGVHDQHIEFGPLPLPQVVVISRRTRRCVGTLRRRPCVRRSTTRE
jgi:hypothetical protein